MLNAQPLYALQKGWKITKDGSLAILEINFKKLYYLYKNVQYLNYKTYFDKVIRKLTVFWKIDKILNYTIIWKHDSLKIIWTYFTSDRKYNKNPICILILLNSIFSSDSKWKLH